jgi:hypothetical protein
MIGPRSVLTAIATVRITLFFYAAYIVTNYEYVKLPPALELNYGVVFVTSPFNFLETFSHIYANPIQGLEENFGVVLLIILLAETYSRFARVRGGIGIDGAFFLALGATYATSALWWWAEGVPGNGTSIVAFSIVLYLLAVSLADARTYAVRRRRSAAEAGRFLLWITALVISVVVAPTFILGNPSYGIHLAGIAFFGAFLMIRNHTVRREIARLIPHQPGRVMRSSEASQAFSFSPKGGGSLVKKTWTLCSYDTGHSD